MHGRQRGGEPGDHRHRVQSLGEQFRGEGAAILLEVDAATGRCPFDGGGHQRRSGRMRFEHDALRSPLRRAVDQARLQIDLGSRRHQSERRQILSEHEHRRTGLVPRLGRTGIRLAQGGGEHPRRHRHDLCTG